MADYVLRNQDGGNAAEPITSAAQDQKGFISQHRNSRGIPINQASDAAEESHAQLCVQAFHSENQIKSRALQRHSLRKKSTGELRSDEVHFDTQSAINNIHDHAETNLLQSRQPANVAKNFFQSQQNDKEMLEELPKTSMGGFLSNIDGTDGGGGARILSSQDEQVLFLVVNSEADGGSKLNTLRSNFELQDCSSNANRSKITPVPEQSIDMDFVSQADKNDLISCLNQMKTQKQGIQNRHLNQRPQAFQNHNVTPASRNDKLNSLNMYSPQNKGASAFGFQDSNNDGDAIDVQDVIVDLSFSDDKGTVDESGANDGREKEKRLDKATIEEGSSRYEGGVCKMNCSDDVDQTRLLQLVGQDQTIGTIDTGLNMISMINDDLCQRPNTQQVRKQNCFAQDTAQARHLREKPIIGKKEILYSNKAQIQTTTPQISSKNHKMATKSNVVTTQSSKWQPSKHLNSVQSNHCKKKDAVEQRAILKSSTPNMSSKKPNANQLKKKLTLTIEYDEEEFVDSTQEHCMQKNLPNDSIAQFVQPVRGLTPQRPLQSFSMRTSCQELDFSVKKSKPTHSVQSKDQFQGKISMQQMEPKRSQSVSAQESAAELARPYNRRAMLLRERKEQLKQKARENSFNRSQHQMNESISCNYGRAPERMDTVQQSATMSLQQLKLS